MLFAHVPGTTEILVETDFRDFDKDIFFAIRTLDGINESEQSNIVSVFVESLKTTTSNGLVICSKYYRSKINAISNFIKCKFMLTLRVEN